MPLAKVPPVAFDAAIAYGLPATFAAAAAPALARVTDPMVSPFCSPLVVNSVPAKVTV
ncbi:hypothetical protein D3C83_121060 [compost metagenome]